MYKPIGSQTIPNLRSTAFPRILPVVSGYKISRNLSRKYTFTIHTYIEKISFTTQPRIYNTHPHSVLLQKPEFSLNVFCNTLQVRQVLQTEQRRLIRSIELRTFQKAYSDPAFQTPQATLPFMFSKANSLTTLIYT